VSDVGGRDSWVAAPARAGGRRAFGRPKGRCRSRARASWMGRRVFARRSPVPRTRRVPLGVVWPGRGWRLFRKPAPDGALRSARSATFSRSLARTPSLSVRGPPFSQGPAPYARCRSRRSRSCRWGMSPCWCWCWCRRSSPTLGRRRGPGRANCEPHPQTCLTPSTISFLDALSVADRPPEPLDQLRRGVIVAEVLRADSLVQEHRSIGSLGFLGGDDDSGHEIGPPLFEVAVCSPLPRGTVPRFPEGGVKAGAFPSGPPASSRG